MGNKKQVIIFCSLLFLFLAISFSQRSTIVIQAQAQTDTATVPSPACLGACPTDEPTPTVEELPTDAQPSAEAMPTDVPAATDQTTTGTDTQQSGDASSQIQQLIDQIKQLMSGGGCANSGSSTDTSGGTTDSSGGTTDTTSNSFTSNGLLGKFTANWGGWGGGGWGGGGGWHKWGHGKKWGLWQQWKCGGQGGGSQQGGQTGGGTSPAPSVDQTQPSIDQTQPSTAPIQPSVAQTQPSAPAAPSGGAAPTAGSPAAGGGTVAGCDSGGTADPEPAGDYTRVTVSGVTVNVRTQTMLQRAETVAAGLGVSTPFTLAQGSYNPGGVAASAGTHDGGGVVDVEVPDDATQRDNMVRALRMVGFAAWLRTPAEGFAYHIHAVAIGDAELSPSAAAQITNYFDGLNGLADNGADTAPASVGRPVPAWASAYGTCQ